MVKKMVCGKTTAFTFDDANQLVSSTTDGVTTRYAYDAAGRLVKEGNKTYRYGYLDKVLSVTEGERKYAYDYHVDGQLAKADYGDASEDFLWDGLALTAFGEDLSLRCPPPPNFSTLASASFFTGKPEVAGLGHAFLFRNYRAGLAKWQTADPLGYPDGWNQLAYCDNGVIFAVDSRGCYIKIVNEYDDPASEKQKTIDMGWHDESGRTCHWYIIQTLIDHVIIGQDFVQKRRWESIDGLEDILNGIGFGLDISGGYVSVTGIGTIPAAGIVLGGVLCHTTASILDALNGYVDVPNGATFELSRKQIVKDSFEVHVLE